MLAAVVVLAGSGIAAADPTTPDTFKIHYARAYTGVLEDGDFLLIMHYEISYDEANNTPGNDTAYLYLIRMMDGNTSLGAIKPFPFQNNGYGESCAGMYWGANDSIAWASDYTLRVEGTPSEWSSPPLATHTVSGHDYHPYDGTAYPDEMESNLRGHILTIADSLEADWGISGALYSWTQAGPVLSDDLGEGYFCGAIRGLSALCPRLFSVMTLSPTIDLATYEHEQAEAYRDIYDDTIIGDATSALSELFGGIGVQLITSICCLFVFLAIVAACAMDPRIRRATPGFLIGSFMLLLAVPASLMSFMLVAVISFVCVILLGYVLFFKHAAG